LGFWEFNVIISVYKNSTGGAIQFLHECSILEDINAGKLKEVMTWLKKKK
jgi:hypothetical protein